MVLERRFPGEPHDYLQNPSSLLKDQHLLMSQNFWGTLFDRETHGSISHSTSVTGGTGITDAGYSSFEGKI